jgi:ERCC4-type nuclease
VPTDFALPALKSLGELSQYRPVIGVDTREKDPLQFAHFDSKRVGLITGDYSIYQCERAAAIERKSIPDLIGSISFDRKRFERCLMRMRAYPFRRLLIIGERSEIEEHAYRSKMTPKAILHTLAAFEIRYDCPVIWIKDPAEAALQIESWLWWVSRQLVSDCNDLLRGCRNEL